MCIYCRLKVLTSAFTIYQIEKYFVSIFPSILLNQLSNPLKVPLFGGKTSFTFIYTLLYVFGVSVISMLNVNTSMKYLIV